jgi:FkbM family methyltransferase
MSKVLGAKGNIIRVGFSVNGKDYEAYVPDDQLWISIKDVLLNREYEYLPEYELNNFKGIIVDAGAHVGLFSLVASVFAEKVYAIEPHPLNYYLLKANLIKNNVNNVIAINKALWHKIEKVKLYQGFNTATHSVFRGGRTFSVAETITLEDIYNLLENEGFRKIDLLKIDVEGAESRIFERLDMNILTRIEKIVGEIHLDVADFKLIVQNLRNSGFTSIVFRPPLWKKNGSYSIRLYGQVRLKLLRNISYSMGHLAGLRDKDILIIFARRKNGCN